MYFLYMVYHHVYSNMHCHCRRRQKSLG